MYTKCLFLVGTVSLFLVFYSISQSSKQNITNTYLERYWIVEKCGGIEYSTEIIDGIISEFGDSVGGQITSIIIICEDVKEYDEK